MAKIMFAWWVTLDVRIPKKREYFEYDAQFNRSIGQINQICVNAPDETTARVTAKLQGWSVRGVQKLFYPASPQFNPGSCPAFCYLPERCQGKTSCQAGRSCDD